MALTATVTLHPNHNNPCQRSYHNLFLIRISLDDKEIASVVSDYVSVYYTDDKPCVCEYHPSDPAYPYDLENDTTEICIIAGFKGHNIFKMDDFESVDCSAVENVEHEGMGDLFSSNYHYYFEEED